MVELKNFSNMANYDDSDETDNTSEAEIIINIKTGELQDNNIMIIISVLLLAIAGIVLKKIISNTSEK